MDKIKDYIEDYISNVWLFFVSIIFEIAICIYILLFKNSPAVKSITTNESLNTVTKAFNIVQLPDYYQHLIVGLVWIFVLLGIILYTLKQKKYLGTLIYIIFVVVFWLIFWDPILTSFLILGALGIAGIYSFDN
ncbi:hypothetical protein CO687_00010 [Streptococcus gordonii]|uniref:hypothetical protein n=1 Tax=Streptococcus gordonii TaxID=1302 RepID=UPI000BBD3A33|nr:hypothetical protein [Streptococcus gordonii]ATF63969.1 hypothetical protein CO687_00010 [Streptococcus gordonii]